MVGLVIGVFRLRIIGCDRMDFVWGRLILVFFCRGLYVDGCLIGLDLGIPDALTFNVAGIMVNHLWLGLEEQRIRV